MSNTGITLSDDFKALAQTAVESLTGKKVEITFRQPVSTSAQGHVYIALNGTLMIDICPDLPVEELFFVLLHEAGHIWSKDFNLPEFTPCDYWAYPSGFIPENTKEEIAEHIAKPIELQADSFAEQIGDFAQREADYLFGNHEIETRIRVLTMTEILQPEEKRND